MYPAELQAMVDAGTAGEITKIICGGGALGLPGLVVNGSWPFSTPRSRGTSNPISSRGGGLTGPGGAFYGAGGGSGGGGGGGHDYSWLNNRPMGMGPPIAPAPAPEKPPTCPAGFFQKGQWRRSTWGAGAVGAGVFGLAGGVIGGPPGAIAGLAEGYVDGYSLGALQYSLFRSYDCR